MSRSPTFLCYCRDRTLRTTVLHHPRTDSGPYFFPWNIFPSVHSLFEFVLRPQGQLVELAHFSCPVG